MKSEIGDTVIKQGMTKDKKACFKFYTVIGHATTLDEEQVIVMDSEGNQEVIDKEKLESGNADKSKWFTADSQKLISVRDKLK